MSELKIPVTVECECGAKLESSSRQGFFSWDGGHCRITVRPCEECSTPIAKADEERNFLSQEARP